MMEPRKRWVCGVFRSGFHNGASCNPDDQHHDPHWGCGYRYEMSIPAEEYEQMMEQQSEDMKNHQMVVFGSTSEEIVASLTNIRVRGTVLERLYRVQTQTEDKWVVASSRPSSPQERVLYNAVMKLVGERVHG